MTKKQYVMFLGMLIYASSTIATEINSQVYEVEKVLNNGYYIINGVTFKPHTTCKMLEKGDKVKFTVGSPNGDCVSATISNLRTHSTCRLFCAEGPLDE